MEYKQLQDRYDKVMRELKRERRKVRKINREKYNTARDDAANNDATKEIEEELSIYKMRYNNIKNTYKQLLNRFNLQQYKNIIYSGATITLLAITIVQSNHMNNNCVCV